jgi:hypothetical protein
MRLGALVAVFPVTAALYVGTEAFAADLGARWYLDAGVDRTAPPALAANRARGDRSPRSPERDKVKSEPAKSRRPLSWGLGRGGGLAGRGPFCTLDCRFDVA